MDRSYPLWHVRRRSLALLVGASLVGCATPTPPEPMDDEPVATTVTLSETSIELSAPGAVRQIGVEVRDQNGTLMPGAPVSWSSDDVAVATVSAAGLVSGVAEGSATVTASSGSASATTEVTVRAVATTTDTLLPVPLTAMAGITYKGFAGGLYPDGNDMPAAHLQAAMDASARIEPLDVSGQPDPAGAYVLLSIGMSNATQEFCSWSSGYPCDPWTFTGQALADPDVAQTGLEIVNGAASGQVALDWGSPSHPNYDRVLTDHLQPRGLSEEQVQAVWVKTANPLPDVALPDAGADAYYLESLLGDVARALDSRYPNLQMVFFSSRIYAGYATVNLNPEPYAYESGYSIKWLIEAQIEQEATGQVDDRSGDLALGTSAPWLGWGPYIWADGATPNPDGLTWLPGDLESDGTHPSQSGEEKVGSWLLDFFKTRAYTVSWFLQ